MNVRHKVSVEGFLGQLELEDYEKYQIINRLRELVFTLYPKVTERMMYGGIMITNENQEDAGGLFAYKNHVSFEFGAGYSFEDPDGFLEGSGQFRRHVKLRSLKDIEEKRIEFYIKQMIRKDD